MIDPFTIITVLSSYATGQKVGGLISDWSFGKNIRHLQNGVEHCSNGIEKQDTAFMEKAISELDYVNTEDDRLFVVAFSYLYRAVCYTYLLKFSLAYHYLDELEAITFDYFTRKKDTIEETKSYGRSFRNEVVELETAYNEYLASLNNHEDKQAVPVVKNNWKIAFIVLAATAAVAAIIALLFIIL